MSLPRAPRLEKAAARDGIGEAVVAQVGGRHRPAGTRWHSTARCKAVEGACSRIKPVLAGAPACRQAGQPCKIGLLTRRRSRRSGRRRCSSPHRRLWAPPGPGLRPGGGKPLCDSKAPLLSQAACLPSRWPVGQAWFHSMHKETVFLLSCVLAQGMATPPTLTQQNLAAPLTRASR